MDITNHSINFGSVGMAHIKTKPSGWLWKDWLAVGKVHLLVGDPGIGKTTIALNVAATLTGGGIWPDGTHSEPGNVLIHCLQDNLNDTVLPRLIAQGADLKRAVCVNTRSEDFTMEIFDPAGDVIQLQEAIVKAQVKFIIIDPLANLISDHFHTNHELRKELRRLGELAAQTQAAVLAISYFPKRTSRRNILERLKQSMAQSGLVQSVLVAEKINDQYGGLRRSLSKIALNHSSSQGHRYHIAQMTLPNHRGIVSSGVMWDGSFEGDVVLRRIKKPRHFFVERLLS